MTPPNPNILKRYGAWDTGLRYDPKGLWTELIKTAYDGESGSAGFLRFCEREKYIRLMAEERMIGEIVSIYLLPEYIGKGWGKALLQRAVEELHKEGYRDIFLWVLEENRNARGFYERMGFRKREVYLNDNIGGRDLREVQYVYSL